MLPNSHHWLSVLEALQTNKSPLLATQMQELGTTCRVFLQWIPAHCRIPGNKQADQLAKCWAQEEQPSTSIHYQERTTIIKTAQKPRHDAYHLLDRPGQVVLARLRSGNNRLNAHMHRKLKFIPSSKCPCGEEDQTTEHVEHSQTHRHTHNNTLKIAVCLTNEHNKKNNERI